MGERLDAVVGRKYTNRQGEEKTSWTRIGTLFIADDGKRSLKLDALPLPNDKGEVWISFFEPKDRSQAAPAKAAPGSVTRGRPPDDGPPF